MEPHSSLSTLPPEVFEIIAKTLCEEDRSALSKLARCNRRSYELAMPFLLRSIDVHEWRVSQIPVSSKIWSPVHAELALMDEKHATFEGCLAGKEDGDYVDLRLDQETALFELKNLVLLMLRRPDLARRVRSLRMISPYDFVRPLSKIKYIKSYRCSCGCCRFAGPHLCLFCNGMHRYETWRDVRPQKAGVREVTSVLKARASEALKRRIDELQNYYELRIEDSPSQDIVDLRMSDEDAINFCVSARDLHCGSQLEDTSGPIGPMQDDTIFFLLLNTVPGLRRMEIAEIAPSNVYPDESLLDPKQHWTHRFFENLSSRKPTLCEPNPLQNLTRMELNGRMIGSHSQLFWWMGSPRSEWINRTFLAAAELNSLTELVMSEACLTRLGGASHEEIPRLSRALKRLEFRACAFSPEMTELKRILAQCPPLETFRFLVNHECVAVEVGDPFPDENDYRVDIILDALATHATTLENLTLSSIDSDPPIPTTWGSFRSDMSEFQALRHLTLGREFVRDESFYYNDYTDWYSEYGIKRLKHLRLPWLEEMEIRGPGTVHQLCVMPKIKHSGLAGLKTLSATLASPGALHKRFSKRLLQEAFDLAKAMNLVFAISVNSKPERKGNESGESKILTAASQLAEYPNTPPDRSIMSGGVRRSRVIRGNGE